MPQKTKEEKSEYNKQYRINNKEKLSKLYKEWYIKNRDQTLKKKAEYNRETNFKNIKKYRETAKGKKNYRIQNWRKSGLIGDYEMIYRIYLSTKFCDECGFELNTGDNRKVKCMDHHHASGIFRNILCCSCNTKRR
tara:strand:- start:2679 stop:3086 length:408 start_codon:yes stop_codon:yes gene_type:complete